jgi:hypothetical protein
MRRRQKITARTAATPRLSDQGFVNLKSLLALLLLGVAGFVILRVAPPYFSDMQLADKIRTEARFAQANNKTPDQVRASILRSALQLDIPLTADNIQVEMDASGTHITANYTVTVDLYYHQVDWAFHIDSHL